MIESLVRQLRNSSGRIGIGPAYFGYRNDIPAVVCPQLVLLYSVTVLVYSAFLLGVFSARSRRISTFYIGSLTILNFFVIVNSLFEPMWLTGKSAILSSYCMFDPTMFVRAEIGLNIGLDHFNVTYEVKDDGRFSAFYNNRFELSFGGRHTYQPPSYKLQAFGEGLPNPMISVAEYMETFGGGFYWGTK